MKKLITFVTLFTVTCGYSSQITKEEITPENVHEKRMKHVREQCERDALEIRNEETRKAEEKDRLFRAYVEDVKRKKS